MQMKRIRCLTCNCFLRSDIVRFGFGTYAVKARETPGALRCWVCPLVGMTSQEVRWADDEDRGYDAEGESINAVEHWVSLDEARGDPRFQNMCNSVLETRATSHWEPRVLIRTPTFDLEILDFPTGLDAWRAAGIGTNAAGEVIWNEEDHMDLLRTGS